MNTENSKMNEPLKLSQSFELRSSKKIMLLFKACLFITRGKI